jgi:hypothetical protein
MFKKDLEIIKNFFNNLKHNGNKINVGKDYRQILDNMFRTYIKNSSTNNDAYKKFKEIYKNMVLNNIFDSNFAKKHLKNYPKDEYTVKEMKLIDYETVSKYQKGNCRMFAHALSVKLDELKINNWYLSILIDGVGHAVNVYEKNNQLYVADITQDIVYDNYMKNNGKENTTITKCLQLPIEDYLNDKFQSIISNIEDINYDEHPFSPLYLFLRYYNNIIQKKNESESCKNK